MTKWHGPLIPALAFLIGAFFLSACTHHSDASQQLTSALSPFTQSRDETVALVTTAKHSLGSADLNTLAASYSALQGKANAYASFAADTVRAASFDPDKNSQEAAVLTDAITTFNTSFASISPPAQQGQIVSSAWVSAFSGNVSAYWSKYHDALTTVSPQTKADLVKNIQKDMLWPNYENIATESIAPARP